MFSSEPTFEFLTFDLVFVETWEKKKEVIFTSMTLGTTVSTERLPQDDDL